MMLIDLPDDFKRSAPKNMNQLCRQVSIESPGIIIKDCVSNLEVPVPAVPANGARIRVVCAGACYLVRNRSSSASTNSHNESDEISTQMHHGICDAAFFPGYEVSGVIDELGEDVSSEYTIGQRVVLYPFEGVPHGYAEYIVVPHLRYLIPIPDNLTFGVAATLPTGALLAKNAVLAAHEHVKKLIKERPSPNQEVKILIVGTGGLALWAVRIAGHQFKSSEYKDRVKVTVASLRDEGFKLAKEIVSVNLVQWNEDVHETQIIERTTDACNGFVDIVIGFGTSSRCLQRSLQCLNEKGVVLVNEEVAERLLPKFSQLAASRRQKIEAVAKGDIEQLKELVHYVSTGEITPPPHTEFPAEKATEVVHKLCHSEIPGRAILRFQAL